MTEPSRYLEMGTEERGAEFGDQILAGIGAGAEAPGIRDAHRAEATGLVLSEGENWIVALAAFLAEIRGSGRPMPFVFDDPISSVAQEFEERVVPRLVALATSSA